MASAAARERYARKNEQDELERAFRTIDKKGDNKIDADELNQLFLALGHKVGLMASNSMFGSKDISLCLCHVTWHIAYSCTKSQYVHLCHMFSLCYAHFLTGKAWRGGGYDLGSG